MNTTAVLKTTAERGGPIAMTAGVAALTAALVGVGHNRVAAQPKPAPTVTVTATRQVVADRPSSSRTSTPHATAGSGAGVGSVREPDVRPVAVAERRPSAGVSGPSPTAQAPSGRSCTGIAAVSLLGRCALTVGGNR